MLSKRWKRAPFVSYIQFRDNKGPSRERAEGMSRMGERTREHKQI